MLVAPVLAACASPDMHWHEGRGQSYWIREAQDEDPEGLVRSIRALNELGVDSAEVLQALHELAMDPEPRVRYHASAAIGSFPGHLGRFEDVLRKGLGDSIEAVRVVSAASLVSLGCREQEVLATLLSASTSMDKDVLFSQAWVDAASAHIPVDELLLIRDPELLAGVFNAFRVQRRVPSELRWTMLHAQLVPSVGRTMHERVTACRTAYMAIRANASLREKAGCKPWEW